MYVQYVELHSAFNALTFMKNSGDHLLNMTDPHKKYDIKATIYFYSKASKSDGGGAMNMQISKTNTVCCLNW